MPIQFNQTTAGVLTLQAPASGSYSLQFPSGNGSNGQYLVSDGTGGLSWSGLSGLSNITPALNTASPNNTVNDSSLSATGGTTNVFFALTTSANGGTVQAQIADSTATGGNSRGSNAFDFQRARSSASQVASGTSSSVIGGSGNTASGTYSTVVGGLTNVVSATAGFIGGGQSNTVSVAYGAILGGYQNTVNSSASGSVILGGRANTADYQNQAILGGYGGSGNSTLNLVVFPTANPLGASTTDALIGAGQVDSTYSNSNSLSGFATIDGSSTATANNQINLRTNSVYLIETYAAWYEFFYPLYTTRYGACLVRRAATAASTSIIAGSGDLSVLYKSNAFNDYLHVLRGVDTTYGAYQLTCYSDQVNHSGQATCGNEFIYLQY